MSQFNDQLEIETPENLTLHAPIAGFATRCLAALIDNLIIAVFFVIILLIFPPVFTMRFNSAALVIGMILLGMGLYHLIFELFWNGQSPGKKRYGIRVIRANGLPLTPTAAIVRNFVRIFDFLPFGYGVGMTALFATPKTQRLGDLAAGTIVIQEQKQVTLTSLRTTAAPIPRLGFRIDVPDYIDISNLTEDDRRIVVDFLVRRGALTNTESLSVMLAKRMSEKMALTQQFGMWMRASDAEMLLFQIARAFELRDDARNVPQ